mmetsp:Transcript_7238/g.8684  ORF Transcript_7238/g.8684 Transcript_7238/m.8684 type:complete len:81 (+) Transcript_7238:222-464(+)
MRWKKQLPMGAYEDYRLRHMGLNLIAFSDERATMFNSQGSVAFEQPLEGDGRSVIEMFKGDDGNYSCFVRGDNIVVYKHS